MQEIWKDIEGYEGIYQISNFGGVRRLYSADTTHTYIVNGYKQYHHYFSLTKEKQLSPCIGKEAILALVYTKTETQSINIFIN